LLCAPKLPTQSFVHGIFRKKAVAQKKNFHIPLCCCIFDHCLTATGFELPQQASWTTLNLTMMLGTSARLLTKHSEMRTSECDTFCRTEIAPNVHDTDLLCGSSNGILLQCACGVCPIPALQVFTNIMLSDICAVCASQLTSRTAKVSFGALL